MTSTFPNISISTERLVLRPLDEDDVPALAEMMNDEQVAAWTEVPQPFTEAGARRWITQQAPAERAAGRGRGARVEDLVPEPDTDPALPAAGGREHAIGEVVRAEGVALGDVEGGHRGTASLSSRPCMAMRCT